MRQPHACTCGSESAPVMTPPSTNARNAPPKIVMKTADPQSPRLRAGAISAM